MKEKSLNTFTLQAKFLGGFELTINSCVMSEITSQKSKGLFSYLLLEKQKVHSRSTLASIFWPDVSEQTALHNLRQALSTIKKTLSECINGFELFSSDRDTLSVNAEIEIKVDVIEFENKIQPLLDCYNRQKSRGFPIKKLINTMKLIGGELLPLLTLPDSDLFEDWIVLKRERINRLLVQGYSILLQYYEMRCEWDLAKKIAEKLLLLSPWDEDIHVRLIHIYLRTFQANTALSHYNSTIRYLKNTLEVEPGLGLKKAYQEIQDFFSFGTHQISHNISLLSLPGYATPFVGRENELEVLEDWISNPVCHIITITGPGGCGKTRLAAEFASIQNGLFKDGVFFVSLARCSKIEQISTEILGKVRANAEYTSNATQELLEWAQNRSTLLILDNVEDLKETAILAKQLIEAAPQLILIFTFYSFLDLIGEKVLALSGLSTADGQASDAMKLFYSHLQFENLPEIYNLDFVFDAIQICETVEGYPLAIDLAACQTRWIPISEIRKGLQENINILCSRSINIPERHRSIQASFENVWQRLTTNEKKLLSRLTFFASPFTAQAAEAVCDVNTPFLLDLSKRSLLIWDGLHSYRFHRVVRQNVLEKSGFLENEEESTSSRHADWFYLQATNCFKDRSGESFCTFQKKIEDVLPDIVKGINWFILKNNWQRVEELISPLNTYFESKSLFREGTALFEDLVKKCSYSDQALVCYAKFSCRTALFRLRIHQFENVLELINFGLDTARKLKLQDEEAYCLNALATHAFVRKNASTAQKYAIEALDISRLIKNKAEEAHSLYNLGYAQDNMGDITKAEETLLSCKLLCEELMDWRRLSKVLNIMADIACFRGDYHLAIDYYEQALLLIRKLKNIYSESLLLNNLGTAFLELKIFPKALDCFSKSLELCYQIVDREGEAIALSNLGETAGYQKDFKKAIIYNEQSLAISEEIESDWGILSARAVLAESYRELGDKTAAKKELLALLPMSLQKETMNFFHRGVVEACRLIDQLGHSNGLASILDETINAEGAEESTRMKAKITRALLSDEVRDSKKLKPEQIISILSEKLNRAL